MPEIAGATTMTGGRRSPRRIVAAAGALPWLLAHTLLYAVLLVVGMALPEFAGEAARTPGDNLRFGLADASIVAVVLVPLAVVLLALLRLGRELRWYWFRLLALVLFNLSDPLFLESAEPWTFALVNSVMALLVVQPRWGLED